MHEVRYEGAWWVADDPAAKSPGVLTYTFTSGLTLVIYGSLKIETARRRGAYANVIHGSARTDRFFDISLFHCSLTENSEDGSVATQTFAPSVALIGGHVADLLWKLQVFFALIADQGNAITDLTVSFEGIRRPLQMLFRHPFEHQSRRHVIQYLFTFSTIAERASRLFTDWFSLYGSIGPVLNALGAVVFERQTFADARFLALAQAAESYHRRTMNNEVLPAEEHACRVDAIKAACPAEHREWLDRRLKNSNEPPFESRIREIFLRLDPHFRRLMFSSKKTFADNVSEIRDWRNKLTHLRVDNDEVDRNLLRISTAANQLYVGLLANVLIDLGFKSSELRERFDQNERYRWWSRQWPMDDQ